MISPDLTRNDPETLKSSGGPITQDNTGVEYYGNIFAATESPYEEGVIWTGSDDGLLHVTRDGGKNWKNVTPPMSPKWNMMNCIDVHPTIKGGAYVAATSYKFGDYTPYLFKTTDYGESWELITSGIEASHYTRAIRADPKRSGLLYAGTEWGMYISFDDGKNWQPFQLNLPIVSIRDLHVRDNNLIAATHGRSFWMIDDLTPLHQLDAKIADRDFYLYQPKPSHRMAQGRSWGGANYNRVGKNHPNGVIFNFFCKLPADSATAQLEIMEPDGEVIRTYSSKAKKRADRIKVKKGGNTFVWDMRYKGFKEFPGMVLYSSPNRGPRAVPGKYKARLTINGESVEQEFEIVKDPRLPNTREDFQKQFDFLVKTRDKVSEAHQAIIDIRQVKTDMKYIKGKIGEAAEFKDVTERMNELKKQLEVIENNIHMTKNQSRQDPLNYGIRVNNRLAFLMQDQQRGDFPPTDQAEAVRQELTEALDKELGDLNVLLDTELEQINEELQKKGVQILGGKKEKEVN